MAAFASFCQYNQIQPPKIAGFEENSRIIDDLVDNVKITYNHSVIFQKEFDMSFDSTSKKEFKDCESDINDRFIPGEQFEEEEFLNIHKSRGFVYDEKVKGIVFTDQDTIRKQGKVISFMIKKMGLNILRGKSIMNVSMPVAIFDKCTLL